jgi:hypothetical protein
LNEKYSDTGGAFHFAMGGNIAPGVVLGGLFFPTALSRPKLESDVGSDDSSEVDVQFSQLSALVDVYPNPSQGLHVLGALGFGFLERLDPAGNKLGDTHAGLAVNLGVGYDFWVHKEWSVGVLGSFTMAWLNAKDELSREEVKSRFMSPAVSVTAVYH